MGKKKQATTEELIMDILSEKSVLKQDVYQKTIDIFKEFKSVLQSLEKEYRTKTRKIPGSVLIEFRDKSDFEAEFKIAGDALVFIMHTNVFNFPKEHAMWRTSYVQEEPMRAYCGMICVYNFLADSFKYNRVNDLGYLIGRLFLNKDLHFFVEGKRQLGFLYNSFENAVIDKDQVRAVIESAILYSLDFDLYTPPYEQMKQLSVSEIIESASKMAIATGKRLGFRFQADDDLIE